MSRILTNAERECLEKGLKPRCSECREEIDIVDGADFENPGVLVILPHVEVCPLSHIEWGS